MGKIKLGNDFTQDGESDTSKGEASDQKDLDENLDDEKENSGDPDDSENQEESEESVDDKDESEETDESTDEEDSEELEEESEEDKKKALQGLLNAEKDLDTDLGTIDEQIAAAKQRISAKRGDRRGKRELVENIDTKFPEAKEDEENTDDLSDIDPETLKVLDRFTKAKGLVPKSELKRMSYQDQHKAAEEAFYDSHPEYKPENDADDALYTAIKKELSYFAPPKDAKDIPLLFKKAHDAVVKQFPKKFKSDNTTKVVAKDNNEVVNKNVRLKTQGLGGKSSGGSSGGGGEGKSSKKSFSEDQIRALQDGGWSQDEIKRLTS